MASSSSFNPSEGAFAPTVSFSREETLEAAAPEAPQIKESSIPDQKTSLQSVKISANLAPPGEPQPSKEGVGISHTVMKLPSARSQEPIADLKINKAKISTESAAIGTIIPQSPQIGKSESSGSLRPLIDAEISKNSSRSLASFGRKASQKVMSFIGKKEVKESAEPPKNEATKGKKTEDLIKDIKEVEKFKSQERKTIDPQEIRNSLFGIMHHQSGSFKLSSTFAALPTIESHLTNVFEYLHNPDVSPPDRLSNPREALMELNIEVKTKLSAADKKTDALKQKQNELMAPSKTMGELKSELSKLDKEIKKLEGKLNKESGSEDVKQLETGLVALQSKKTSMEKVRKECEAIEKEIADLPDLKNLKDISDSLSLVVQDLPLVEEGIGDLTALFLGIKKTIKKLSKDESKTPKEIIGSKGNDDKNLAEIQRTYKVISGYLPKIEAGLKIAGKKQDLVMEEQKILAAMRKELRNNPNPNSTEILQHKEKLVGIKGEFKELEKEFYTDFAKANKKYKIDAGKKAKSSREMGKIIEEKALGKETAEEMADAAFNKLLVSLKIEPPKK